MLFQQLRRAHSRSAQPKERTMRGSFGKRILCMMLAASVLAPSAYCRHSEVVVTPVM